MIILYFFVNFAIFTLLFLDEYALKKVNLYHHSIANFPLMSKMGLFLKKSSLDLEIFNDMYNKVNLCHIWPIVLKGLDKDVEILILVSFMVFSM